MKFLPESNGVYKVNTKRKLKPFEKLKLIVFIVFAIFLVGTIYQKIHDFSVNESLRYRYNYTRVNDKKMDYVLKGTGDYTVIFDGDIGGDLTQWIELTKQLNDEGIRTFTYNRQGYGFSDGGSKISPEEQAENLKILLRKAGVGGRFILVGEGYGSLVMTNFAKLYPDSVEAMILVNPLDETKLSSKELKKEYRFTKIRRFIEKIGSKIGITNLLDKLGLTIDMEEYEDKIPDLFKEEFTKHRVMSNYNSAVYNELDNILNGTSVSQSENLLNGKPLYLITKDKDDRLRTLSTENSTYIHETSKDSSFMALEDEESILAAVKYVVKELNMRKRFSQ